MIKLVLQSNRKITDCLIDGMGMSGSLYRANKTGFPLMPYKKMSCKWDQHMKWKNTKLIEDNVEESIFNLGTRRMS